MSTCACPAALTHGAMENGRDGKGVSESVGSWTECRADAPVMAVSESRLELSSGVVGGLQRQFVFVSGEDFATPWWQVFQFLGSNANALVLVGRQRGSRGVLHEQAEDGTVVQW